LLDMLKKYAFSFYEVISRLQRELYSASLTGSSSYKSTLYSHQHKEILKLLKDVGAECEILALEHTSDLAAHFESCIREKDEEYSNQELLKDLETLNFSFANELRRRFFFRIADDKQKYFQQDDLFGSKVSAAFPYCVAEIQNAGTCYALEQNEACVFHLMRVLERGLSVLAIKFSVPFQHDNWHNIIEQLESKIRKMDPTFGTDWKEKQKFYSAAASQFMFLKDAWRNHVMHVRDVYDEGRAFSIFSHVKELMQSLAEGGLKESVA